MAGTDDEERMTILQTEVDTADHACKGACNFALLRINAFIKVASKFEEDYQAGQSIYDMDEDTWVSDMQTMRHSMELVFQEFTRVQYYKNMRDKASKLLVDATAQKIVSNVEDEYSSSGHVINEESKTEPVVDPVTDPMHELTDDDV